jgi:uncharacterized protein YjiS (DUF1127 family)
LSASARISGWQGDNVVPLTTATLGSSLVALAAAVHRPLTAIRRWHQVRRDYRILCEMDDNLLRDLGLTRGDLWYAIGREDPTSIGAARAAERKAVRKPAEASR